MAKHLSLCPLSHPRVLIHFAASCLKFNKFVNLDRIVCWASHNDFQISRKRIHEKQAAESNLSIELHRRVDRYILTEVDVKCTLHIFYCLPYNQIPIQIACFEFRMKKVLAFYFCLLEVSGFLSLTFQLIKQHFTSVCSQFTFSAFSLLFPSYL